MAKPTTIGVKIITLNLGPALIERLKDFSWRHRMNVSQAARSGIIKMLEEEDQTSKPGEPERGPAL